MQIRHMLVELPDYVYSGIGTLIFVAVFVWFIMYSDAPSVFNAPALTYSITSTCIPAFMLQWRTNFTFAKTILVTPIPSAVGFALVRFFVIVSFQGQRILEIR